ncbi:MAG TPA: VOC family protein [Oleiagrimonas sp.]|nr:VOC family protein [Oleiagrimonas sp.]
MNTHPRFGFVVHYVQDIEASTRFYVDTLGLAIERHHPAFVQFDTFAIASDTPMDGAGKPELYWLIEDVEAVFSELSSKAEITLPVTEKPFGKVFGIKDPDGHPRYLLELARERPSQRA